MWLDYFLTQGIKQIGDWKQSRKVLNFVPDVRNAMRYALLIWMFSKWRLAGLRKGYEAR